MSLAIRSTARQDRLQGLRSDLALKERELTEVRARIAELETSRPPEVIDFLTQACKDRKLLNTVPLTQVGNTIMLFKTATDEELEKQRILKKTIAEIELQVKNAHAAAFKSATTMDKIRQQTGYTKNPLSPSSKAQVIDVDEGEMYKKLHAIKVTVTAQRVVYERKLGALAKVNELLAKRSEQELELSEILNNVLVRDRAINERKEVLRSLLVRHADLDQQIKDAQDRQDVTTESVLQLDVAAYKQKSAEVIELRRAEDRILKAQEARMVTLDNRIEMIKSVLAAHNLLAPVESLVAQQCREADERRLRSASTAGQEPEDNASEIDDIIAKYSLIDVLAPEYEVLPASILSLFDHDLKHHERQVRLKEVMVQEKEDTKISLIAKVKDLHVDREVAVDRLHELKEIHEANLDDRVNTARGELAGRKQEFDVRLPKMAQFWGRLRLVQTTDSRSASSAPQQTTKADTEAKRRPTARNQRAHSGTTSTDPVQTGW
jgi:hypothetical protein